MRRHTGVAAGGGTGGTGGANGGEGGALMQLPKKLPLLCAKAYLRVQGQLPEEYVSMRSVQWKQQRKDLFYWCVRKLHQKICEE